MCTDKDRAGVNAGILEVRGISFEEGMRVFERVFGKRMRYFPAPNFGDIAPGFGERMAETLAR